MFDNSSEHERPLAHPHDTPLSSGLRFLSELITWIAGPWAAFQVSTWLGVAAAVILIGLPSVFSTPNDKNTIIMPTPGPVRVLIELFLYAVAATAPWFVWSTPVAVACCAIVSASVAFGLPRFQWLIKGASIRR